MSVHKDCGELINWFKRPDDLDRFLPPMEYVGEYYMTSDAGNGEKVAVQVAAYKVHHCDPDKMLAWQEYKAKLAAIKERGEEQPHVDLGKTDWEIARDRRQEQARAFAEQVECPTCNAAVDQPCYNLTIYYRSDEKDIVPVKNPHPARVKLAEE